MSNQISRQSPMVPLSRANESYLKAVKKQKKAKWQTIALVTLLAVGVVLALHIGLHASIHTLDFDVTAGAGGLFFLGATFFATNYVAQRILKHHHQKELTAEKIYGALTQNEVTQQEVDQFIAKVNRLAYRAFLNYLNQSTTELDGPAATKIANSVALNNKLRFLRYSKNVSLAIKLQSHLTDNPLRAINPTLHLAAIEEINKNLPGELRLVFVQEGIDPVNLASIDVSADKTERVVETAAKLNEADLSDDSLRGAALKVARLLKPFWS